MGWFFSDDVQTTNKLETTGNVNNNIAIEEPLPIHNNQIIILLYLIVALKVFQIALIIFNSYKKSQKKKYIKRGLSMNNIDRV